MRADEVANVTTKYINRNTKGTDSGLKVNSCNRRIKNEKNEQKMKRKDKKFQPKNQRKLRSEKND